MSLFYKFFPGLDCISRPIYFYGNVNRIKVEIFRRKCLNTLSICSLSKESRPIEKCSYQLDNFIAFEDMIKTRRNEASRSCVVQVNSENSCPDLYDYCQSKATVKKMLYYTYHSNHYVLVEFTDTESSKKLFRHHTPNQSIESPFFWFSASKDKKSNTDCKPREDLPLIISNPQATSEEINQWFAASESLSDEMEVLFTSIKLSDLGVRLRMLCARQIEMVLSGLCTTVKALPFGSTVNSFGKEGCDLDLVLRLGSSSEEDSQERRLIYHSKYAGSLSRGQTQRQMEVLGDILQIFVPGIVGVKRILGARVPIIKYSHEYTGIDTDISLTNLSAVYMSELLYLFGHLDPVGQRLVFTIKCWAKAVGLTSSSPGRWITNFSLAILCIFYLQRLKRLPPFDELIRAARKEDQRYADDINCTFLRDLRHFNVKMNQTETAEELLVGFFNFYQSFNFEDKSINICTGEISSKPDYSPLYILNPLERSLNISKNVSLDEIEKLRLETRNAAWIIETKGSIKELLARSLTTTNVNRKYVSRLVAVRDLFS